jgi:hypothetical protein
MEEFSVSRFFFWCAVTLFVGVIVFEAGQLLWGD